MSRIKSRNECYDVLFLSGRAVLAGASEPRKYEGGRSDNASSCSIAARPGEPAGQPSRDGSDIYPDLRKRDQLTYWDGYWLVVPSPLTKPCSCQSEHPGQRDGTVRCAEPPPPNRLI